MGKHIKQLATDSVRMNMHVVFQSITLIMVTQDKCHMLTDTGGPSLRLLHFLLLIAFFPFVLCNSLLLKHQPACKP